MKNLCFNLFVALLTLSIGLFAGSLWKTYNSADKRLAGALYKVYVKDFEENRQKRAASVESLKIQIKNVERQYSCEFVSGMKRNLEERQQQLATEAENSQAEMDDSFRQRIASDVEKANEGCRKDSLSKRECDRRKELAIKSIYETILK